MPKLTCSIGGTALWLALSCSSGPPAAPRTSRDFTTARAPVADPKSRTSSRLGYSWLLPDGWTFRPPEPFWNSLSLPALDVYAAQQSSEGPILLVIARDEVHIVPGKHPGDDPKDYDGLEQAGADTLREANAELVSTARLQMFDIDTVQVTGDSGNVRISIRLLYRGYRRFEFRCFDLKRNPGWQCASALSAFRIEDLPESGTEYDPPQVLHLRDARYGVAFDAPDDSWLSFGPHQGWGGTQTVWAWNHAGRQIDVQTLDLSALPTQPDQAIFAKRMGDAERASGANIAETQVAFAGHLWHHLEMSGGGHGKRDLFVLVAQGVMYGLLITQPNRDQRLIEAAKKGFRLIPKAPSPR